MPAGAHSTVGESRLFQGRLVGIGRLQSFQDASFLLGQLLLELDDLGLTLLEIGGGLLLLRNLFFDGGDLRLECHALILDLARLRPERGRRLLVGERLLFPVLAGRFGVRGGRHTVLTVFNAQRGHGRGHALA